MSIRTTLSPGLYSVFASVLVFASASMVDAQVSSPLPAGRSFYDETLKLALVFAPGLSTVEDEAGQVYRVHPDSTYAYPIGSETYQLYFTRLPVVTFQANEDIVDEPKRPVRVTYVDAEQQLSSWAGIELRGGSSQTFDKKTYDLEFWEDASGDDSEDEQFADLRDDDDWVLDGLYNEPLRIRSQISHRLWTDMHEVHYLDEEPKAKAGPETVFVELLINGRYRGLYALSEQIDRKLLRLQKQDDGEEGGQLWKGESWGESVTYDGLTPGSSVYTEWFGQQARYPSKTAPIDWSKLYAATELVVEADDATFRRDFETHFHLDNILDNFIFLAVTTGHDNRGKNIYTAARTPDAPFFMVPWDLDGVFGNGWDGLRWPETTVDLSNGLFNRLLDLDYAQTNDRLRLRWQELRAGLLSETNLVAAFSDRFDRFTREHVYARETLVADNYSYDQESLDYTLAFIRGRLNYLDGFFDALSSSLSGPTPKAQGWRLAYDGSTATAVLSWSATTEAPKETEVVLLNAVGQQQLRTSISSNATLSLVTLPAGTYVFYFPATGQALPLVRY